jgi:hypothetical protein
VQSQLKRQATSANLLRIKQCAIETGLAVKSLTTMAQDGRSA